MTNEIYAISFRSHYRENIYNKIQRLCTAAFADILPKGFWAITANFGELGSSNFIRPVFYQPINKWLTEKSAKTILLSTNRLFKGSRNNTCDHLRTALANGFIYESVQAPLMIADNLSLDKDLNAINNLNFDGIVSVSSFFPENFMPFWGSKTSLILNSQPYEVRLKLLKNLIPESENIKNNNNCLTGAIRQKENKFLVDEKKCIGCLACLQKGIKLKDYNNYQNFLEKIFYFQLQQPVLYITFLNSQNNPNFTCSDIAILAGMNPIAIDLAAIEILRQSLPKNQIDNLYESIFFTEFSSFLTKNMSNKILYNINYLPEVEGIN